MQMLPVNAQLRCLLFAACLVHLPAYSETDALAHARVEASYAALQSAERDYRHLRSRDALSARESADYRAYLAQLRRRFFAACAEMAQMPSAQVGVKTPCPARPPADTQAAFIDQKSERTQLERSRALAQELDAALSDFDETLLREQERVKAATPPQTVSDSHPAGQGAGGAGTDGRQGLEFEEQAAEDASQSSGRMASTDGNEASDHAADSGQGDAVPGRSGGQGGGQQVAAQGAPRHIPDGSDDDVVARQLREAAQKERDPELRARLWEEYRRYKRGTP